jgi:hypothetical protein
MNMATTRNLFGFLYAGDKPCAIGTMHVIFGLEITNTFTYLV